MKPWPIDIRFIPVGSEFKLLHFMNFLHGRSFESLLQKDTTKYNSLLTQEDDVKIMLSKMRFTFSVDASVLRIKNSCISTLILQIPRLQ